MVRGVYPTVNGPIFFLVEEEGGWLPYKFEDAGPQFAALGDIKEPVAWEVLREKVLACFDDASRPLVKFYAEMDTPRWEQLTRRCKA